MNISPIKDKSPVQLNPEPLKLGDRTCEEYVAGLFETPDITYDEWFIASNVGYDPESLMGLRLTERNCRFMIEPEEIKSNDNRFALNEFLKFMKSYGIDRNIINHDELKVKDVKYVLDTIAKNMGISSESIDKIRKLIEDDIFDAHFG